MMKRVLLGCLLWACLASCNKDYSEQFVPYSNNTFNSDTVWKPSLINSTGLALTALQNAPMVDSFEVSTGGTINFPDNLSITFPANACVAPGSAPVYGKVRIEATYLRKKGDFIRYAKPTTSFGYLLQTGGSFNIVLYKNGTALQLAPGISFKIKYRNTSPSTDMKFYYEDLWYTSSDTTATWAMGSANAGNVAVWQQYDSITQSIIKGYEITSTKLQWVNCDFLNDTSQPYTRINISLPLNFTNVNTSVYVVFKNKNIVAALRSDPATRTFYLPKVAIGTDVTLVSISKIGNDYYLGKKDVTTANANLISLGPEVKSLTDISNYLNSL